MVHAVKSTSRTIGAGALADLAAKMEAASKDRDISFVENEHKNTLDLYEKVADAVKKALGSSDESEISDDDDEIMEFAPTDK